MSETAPPPFDHVPCLMECVPAFRSSQEYAGLDDEDRAIEGLVFSAFTRFIERTYDDNGDLHKCIVAIEHFANLNNAESENLLVTEVFENLKRPELIVPRLLPKSRDLYERWLR